MGKGSEPSLHPLNFKGLEYVMPVRSNRSLMMSFLRRAIITIALTLMIALPATAQIGDKGFEEDYDSAWHYYNTGRIEKAIGLFLEMQRRYPGNSRLYLTLGTIYFELGDYDKAEDELRNVLLSEPSKDEAIWANVRLANILLKEGALDAAERHFKRGAVRGADPKALFEVARGLHRIEIQHFLEGRFVSGPFLIHYFPFGGVKQEDLEWLGARLEGSYYVCNEVLRIEEKTPIEIYLYPNVQSFINFFAEGAPNVYPEYGEIHEILDKGFDYLEAICPVLMYRLQVKLNRHGTDDLISSAIPHLMRGTVWGLELHTYVYALIERGMFVDFKIIRHPSFYPMVDKAISGPESASFMAFLMSEHGVVDIRQYLTQPNLEALYGMDIISAQKEWLKWVKAKQSLSEMPEEEINTVLSYVRKFELVTYIPDEAMEWFKKGLEFIDAGNAREGEEEINRIIEAYPDFGLAYYALGRLEFDRGNYDKSKELFHYALDKLTNRGSSWGWAHYSLGHIDEAEEDYINAKMHYEKALEADVPNEVRVVAREKITRLGRIADIAPSPGAEPEPDDLRDAVDLFSFIDLGFLNDKLREMEPYFATELNAASYTQFVSAYETMMQPFTTPIVMHEVSTVESIGDFVRVKAILKLEVPKSEYGNITEFDKYLRLRRGIIRYFLLLRTDMGLKIVEFLDAPSVAGRAKVLEEGGTVIPLKEEN